ALYHNRLHAPIREHLVEDAAVGRVIIHHQHGEPVDVHPVCRVQGIRGVRAVRPGGCSPNRAVKWKVLPLPSSLSTQILPPIIATSCEEIASPRPVPSYLRAIELSACVNASKM